MVDAVSFTQEHHQNVLVCVFTYISAPCAPINEAVSQSDIALHPVQEMTSQAGPETVCVRKPLVPKRLCRRLSLHCCWVNTSQHTHNHSKDYMHVPSAAVVLVFHAVT